MKITLFRLYTTASIIGLLGAVILCAFSSSSFMAIFLFVTSVANACFAYQEFTKSKK